jgi:RNA polymerase sigma-70 factor (ECF subfamily)
MTTDAARLLEHASAGDQRALAALMPLVYAELKQVAARQLRRERYAQTLQPTALVNEAFVRLVGDRHLAWQNRAHFFAIAARSMRQILVERARARLAVKRGGGGDRVTLDEGLVAAAETPVDLLALDEALERLAALDPVQARLVEMRFFGGLTIEEAAEALAVSPATVKRHWTIARAWLKKELTRERP